MGASPSPNNTPAAAAGAGRVLGAVGTNACIDGVIDTGGVHYYSSVLLIIATHCRLVAAFAGGVVNWLALSPLLLLTPLLLHLLLLLLHSLCVKQTKPVTAWHTHLV